ncbi:Mitochondrial import inner membrane translocase subunit TIM44-2 [Apostasia shenzhenica]|uniref:Mitochondrial import inner membrane translocase subunit TIM44-2 n=1 Tax=Apostasia shenzhenica TaxID=1088818 RepID=A0A2I0BEY3_9ASPA|nr:Mitochondrial import inner membrane translocase subunit TIM44-2 [Apostasia shenzhenica]
MAAWRWAMDAWVFASQSKSIAQKLSHSPSSAFSIDLTASSLCFRAFHHLPPSNSLHGVRGSAIHAGTAISLPNTFDLSKHLFIREPKCGTPRDFSMFNEFSKQVSGEAKSNQEFQKSIKDLNEKIGVVREDLKARTKWTTEKLHKSVDDVWSDAEATSKKVAADVKEKLTAAKEEVKETLGLGKQENCESSHTTADSSGVNYGDSATANSESSGNSKAKEADTFFGRFRTTLSSASPKISVAFKKIKETKIHNLAMKGYDLMKDELISSPSKRKRMRYTDTSTSSEPRSTSTDIVVMPSKQSLLGEKWEEFKRKVQNHPIYKRVRGFSKPVVDKGQEIAEDMRETMETSDHPLVHKIIEYSSLPLHHFLFLRYFCYCLNEAVFGENATALSFKEIRRRDPAFSLPDFVQEVQEMIRPVLTAYYKGDVETLKKTCCSEVLERCKGERMAYDSQGIYFDNKILHISEVDVRETKMMGSSPIIILAFQTQQIYCVRDRQGSITSGGQDTIQTVYYAWAMQLVDAEELGEGAYFPVWRLREMQQLGVQALI